MSLSPGIPQGAPTLTEVLIERTFAKPPPPFVDGEFLAALERLDDDPAATVRISRPNPGGEMTDAGTQSGSGPAREPAWSRSSDAVADGRSVDVRA